MILFSFKEVQLDFSQMYLKKSTPGTVAKRFCVWGLVALIWLHVCQQSTFARDNAGATKVTPVRLSAQDLETHHGHMYVGLHNGFIYGILHAGSWFAELIPDKWSNEGEANRWNKWYDSFADLIFKEWESRGKIPGQQTVQVAVLPDKRFELRYAGRIYPGTRVRTVFGKEVALDNSKQTQELFESSVSESLKRAIAASPALPITKNPLREFRMWLTFGADLEQFPRYQALDFGSFARLNAKGDNIAIFMENPSSGMFPGVHCLNDKNGGHIIGADRSEFQHYYKQVQSGKEPDF